MIISRTFSVKVINNRPGNMKIFKAFFRTKRAFFIFVKR